MRAERQTAGRGRLGRSWEMPEGNLAMSGLIRPQPGEGNPAELGFVGSLALHDVVAAHVDPARLQLKWPNDLLLDRAKLSGILLEREGDLLVLGVGVNVAAAPELPDRATISLAHAGAGVTAAALADALVAAFAARRAAWRAGGFAAIRDAWLQRAHPIDTPLRVRGEPVVEGRFAGLSASGALLLDVGAAAPVEIHAGDVWALDGGES